MPEEGAPRHAAVGTYLEAAGAFADLVASLPASLPGPGLGVRILGEVKREYAELLRRADAIFIEELRGTPYRSASGATETPSATPAQQPANWYDATAQAFAVFLPVKSVGVMGDGRTYDYVVALRAAVGMPLADYLSQKIWQPMGAEADASWFVDAGGYETGYIGINATLRDWGRLGMLLANDGALNGRQIVPAGWVKAMTTPEAAHLVVGVASPFNGYGYQTWITGRPRAGGDPVSGGDRFAALGIHGQAIFIDPVSKLVVVHTAAWSDPTDRSERGAQFKLLQAIFAKLEIQ